MVTTELLLNHDLNIQTSRVLNLLWPPPQQANIKNVGIHNLSPGMVTTELLMSGADTQGSKFFINCLGERVLPVSCFVLQIETLVHRLLPCVRAPALPCVPSCLLLWAEASGKEGEVEGQRWQSTVWKASGSDREPP